MRRRSGCCGNWRARRMTMRPRLSDHRRYRRRDRHLSQGAAARPCQHAGAENASRARSVHRPVGPRSASASARHPLKPPMIPRGSGFLPSASVSQKQGGLSPGTSPGSVGIRGHAPMAGNLTREHLSSDRRVPHTGGGWGSQRDRLAAVEDRAVRDQDRRANRGTGQDAGHMAPAAVAQRGHSEPLSP